MKAEGRRVAVVLCGCGHRDGSEVRESVGVLWALSVEGADVRTFAPDAPQAEVRDHLTGEPVGGPRNQLHEAARIARGEIEPLGKLAHGDFDALVLPGGNGAAANLSDFAAKGSKGRVIPELQKAIDGFFAAHKPIGAVCIVPALVALALAGKKLELTVGAAGSAATEIEKLGHKHVVCRADECHVDRAHKVVTTPAYMIGDAALRDVFDGIRKCVHETLALV